jgi:hypothetical protein
MPQGITDDEANALRARCTEFLKGEPSRGSPKRTAIRKAFGSSNFNTFMAGKRGASREGMERTLAVIDGGAAPSKAPIKKGRVWQYIPATEAKRLRAEVLKHVAAKFTSLGDFLSHSMGLHSASQSHMYHLINGTGTITTLAARRLRAALDGKPPEKTSKRAAAPLAIVVEPPKDRRAPRNVLAGARDLASRVLEARYHGDLLGLARELGMTLDRLSRFLKGGGLGLNESAAVIERLSELGAAGASMVRDPGVTVRATLQAWRNGGAGGAVGASVEPPELRARKLVERWGAEAMALVVELAGGAA